ncbi:unnamed protein product [Adineta steineri]|uniref:Carboxymuconolactone decarboxylase-like domain-containing protein n=1 Tax=Adineta steineri TaxID=433720 RepID=A0A814H518_9BILA|nr:unnamed protein product [Adineta steineri]CAF1075130.1 unnamed protein product [Adineta steineri]CAF1286845.1 unnamed protein product [Adineta steineri]CAF1289339.1 unnamed protein product [Adineta steineri]
MSAEDNNQQQQPRLPLKDVPDEIQQKIIELGGNPNLNLYKTLSSNPILLSSWIDIAYSLRNNCTTSRQLRELMILRGAQLWHSNYEWFQHEQMAKQCGLSQEKIDSIKEWKTSSLFDGKEKIAIQLMESLIENRGKLNDELDKQLKKYFTEAEYLELILTGSFYVMVPTVLTALQIQTEN